MYWREEMSKRRLISFDWAMKKLLRSKANFEILEGFLSELLKEDIRILEILESESNKESSHNKYNQVDLKVKKDRKSTRLNSSHTDISRMPSSA